MMASGISLGKNTLEVLRARYLLKDGERRIAESPDGLFRRVAKAVAAAEDAYPRGPGRAYAEERFYRMMSSLEFLPNSPTLMNAGTPMGQLSACFVLPVRDSIDDIFAAVTAMAKIHQTGGGTGFNFSSLRPRGDIVNSTKGEASGPVSFMRIFDEATGVVVQGGKRRGANMGILRCDHPDIEEFVDAKLDGKSFSNFNLSVAATDAFMKSAVKGGRLELVNPRTGRAVRKIDARPLFRKIIHAAWSTGDPGLIFIDEVNRANPTPALGRLEATNPCGELPLLPYESCNLASINLGRMVAGQKVDWETLKDRVHLGIRFLDNVIDVNRYPLPAIRDITLANRKVGLGVMGFADMLIRLNIGYDSPAALRYAGDIMKFIRAESQSASSALAAERGSFPNHHLSVYAPKGTRMRNATVNTIAPTGTISIIAGASSGIEPLFAVHFVRNILSGSRLIETHPLFADAARRQGIYTEKLMSQIAHRGSLGRIRDIPEEMHELFATAFDVPPIQHLRVQAAFQKYTDNSVSKTINLPASSSERDVAYIYIKAHALRCKGITIYRYGSKKEQVLTFAGQAEKRSASGSGRVHAGPEYAGGCISGMCAF